MKEEKTSAENIPDVIDGTTALDLYNKLMNGEIKSKWGYLHFDEKRKVLKKGKWKVGMRGDMSFDNRYFIERNRLTEKNWIIHLMGKKWFDFNEFMPIYLQALRNANIKEVTIKAFY